MSLNGDTIPETLMRTDHSLISIMVKPHLTVWLRKTYNLNHNTSQSGVIILATLMKMDHSATSITARLPLTQLSRKMFNSMTDLLTSQSGATTLVTHMKTGLSLTSTTARLLHTASPKMTELTYSTCI